MSEQSSSPAVKTAGSGAGRWKYLIKNQVFSPTSVLGVVLILLFTYLIVVPILTMLNDAFRVQYQDVRRANAPFGSFTFYYFQRAFASPISKQMLWDPLLNTIIVSVGAMIISLVFGGLLGWLLSRTNMWGRGWLSTALIVPYMLPSWTFAMAWITLLKNRAAGGTMGWMETLGFTPPDWLAYGQFPVMIVLAMHYMPFVILLFGNALKRFDSQLEDSARILGANGVVVARKIILPLMLPSLLSASTLLFARCLGDFGVTYILGAPVNYDVLATSLYRSVVSRQPGVSAVLAGVIIVIGLASVLLDMRLVREANRFVTVGGKGAMDRRSNLGKWRWPATIFAVLVFLVTAVFPLLVLLLTTIMRVPGDFSPSNFTLEYWIGTNLDTAALHTGILLAKDFWMAVWNTIWMVGLSAILAGLLGQFVGYVVARGSKPVGAVLRFVTFLPYLVPGIAFAVAFLSAFAVPRGPIPALYGTGIILVIALTADQMPFASRAGISAMMQLGGDPEEAAQVAGAGWWRRMTRIILPIQRSSLTSGILLPFISGLKGLSLVVLLAVPGTDLLTTYSIRLVDYGYTQASNAVVLMICVIAFFGTMLGQKLGKSSLSDGM